MLVLTQEGALELWKQLLGIANIGNPYVHLFASNYQPAHTDTYATYHAIEVGPGVGYAPIQLVNPGTNWTLSTLGAGAMAAYAQLSWLFTGSAVVYGYWLADSSNTFSLFAELFSGFSQFGPSGGTFLLSLQPWLASWPDVAGIPCTSP